MISLPLHRAAQIRFDLQPVRAECAEGRPERLDPIAAKALGLLHGKFGILDHFFGRLVPGGPANKPIEAVSTISRLAKVIGPWIACFTASATAAILAGSCSEKQQHCKLVAGKTR